MSRNTPKRNISSSSTKDCEKKSKIFVTPNRYASLSEDADSPPEVFSPPPVNLSSQDQLNMPSANMESPSPTKVQSPPFYVSEGYEISTLKSALFDITESSSILFKSTPKYLIIHASTVVAWNTIFKYLAENEQVKFHTHLPKPLKPYSVFIRHLHPSTPVEDIQAYITDKGYEVIQVINILHRINKNALPLFRIDLKPATNNSDILNLDSMLHTKIKIELPKKKRVPPQCKLCQAYFHTSNFCHHNPRCVKCGDNHLSSECSKPPTTPAKCALCSGPHTASYKGCPVYKNIIKNQANLKATKYNELLKHKKRSQPIQQKSNYLNPNAVSTLPPLQIPPHLPEASYASITNSNNSLSHNNFPNDNLLAKFITEFSALINPLISLLTTILQKQFTP